MTDEESKSLTTAESAPDNQLPTEKTINLSQIQELDASGLTEKQIQELQLQHISGMIDIRKKAEELKVDVAALDALLGSFNDQTGKATEMGAHATMTHTQDSSTGRTEIVIGNTDQAGKGKVSRSAAGEKDIKLWVISILAVTAIIIAVVLAGK